MIDTNYILSGGKHIIKEQQPFAVKLEINRTNAFILRTLDTEWINSNTNGSSTSILQDPTAKVPLTTN